MLSALTLLLAKSNSSSLLTWIEAVKEHPIVGVVSVAVSTFVAIVAFGDSFNGFIDFLKRLLRIPESPKDDPQVIRRQLLAIVKKEVNRRLANSLHNLVKLDLYMEDQRQRVGNPRLELVPEDSELSFQAVNRVLHSKSKKPSLDLKFTQKIIEVFDRPDIAGKLLILGKPGSGKTTELLQLAQDLVIRVEKDNQHPVPVILELSSWNGESIDKWVASQFNKLYNLSVDITQQWLTDNQILLMLDGLDELGLTQQRQCIEEINQFLGTTRALELVVCCRREEYEAGQIELDGLNGAVYLEALKQDQIRQYFEELNRLSLWENVRDNSALLELAEKPLFLFMLMVAYQGNPIRSQQELFDAYIEKQLHEPGNQGTYKPSKEPSPEQTHHYLVWLAKQLDAISETEFLIEGLQPSLLSSLREKKFYRLTYGICVCLLGGLLGGFLWGPLGELNSGLAVGLFLGLILGLNQRKNTLTIQPVEKLQWSFPKMISGLRNGLRIGLILGLVLGLILGLMFGLTLEIFRLILGLIFGLIFGLAFGLTFGLILGLAFGLTGGLSSASLADKEIPNQGIIKSLHYAFLIGLIYMLRGGLIFALLEGLIFVLSDRPSAGLRDVLIHILIIGLIFGLLSGANTVVKHFILRIFLTRNGHTPWNYALFLEHAVKHRFIQRTGGRYRFVHDLLRKHFAAMPLE